MKPKTVNNKIEARDLNKFSDEEIRNARENIWGCTDKGLATHIMKKYKVKSNYCISDIDSGKKLLNVVIFEDKNTDPIVFCLDAEDEEAKRAVDFLFRISAEQLDCDLVDIY
jgi:hypothetical protein